MNTKILFQELSTSDESTSKMHMQIFEEQLKVKIESAREEYMKKGRSYEKLGLLFGLLLAILML